MLSVTGLALLPRDVEAGLDPRLQQKVGRGWGKRVSGAAYRRS